MEETPISYTDNAVSALQDVLSDINQEGVKIRLYVAGGGCSGLKYGMAVDENTEENDRVFDISGIPTVIDIVSLKYISGSVVDHTNDLMGGGFKFDNPNAKRGCGCGSSFQPGDDVPDFLDTKANGGCGSCVAKR